MPTETLNSFLCVTINTISSRAKTYGMLPGNTATDNSLTLHQLYDVLNKGGHTNFLKKTFQDELYARPVESIRDIIHNENLSVEQTFSIFTKYVNDTDFGEAHVYRRFLLGYITEKTGVDVHSYK